jgi:polyribonucleotide nucleotidyltransferase
VQWGEWGGAEAAGRQRGGRAPRRRAARPRPPARQIAFETGEIARQAGGAVTLSDGDTVVLATVCAGAKTGDGSFTPLAVHYAERFSAAGRTTGSFIKRDGRPKDGETLISRLVDRPLRPSIAAGWAADTQVLLWVLSYDGVHATEPLAITAAGAALALSEVPAARAVAGARVALLPANAVFADGDAPGVPSPCGGWLVANPTVAQADSSALDLIVAGTSRAVLMIEGYASFVPDAVMAAAVRVGAESVAVVAAAVDGWAAAVGKPKSADRTLPDPKLVAIVKASASDALADAFRTPGLSKTELSGRVDAARRAAAAAAGVEVGTPPDPTSDTPTEAQLHTAFKGVLSAAMRAALLDTGMRSDGRAADAVRPIASRAGLLPRTHGSALFTRGETQAVAVATLGSDDAAQKIDDLATVARDASRRFYLQYYFPPCSVGETGRVGAPGRREIGHGALAERALAPAVPERAAFPYTVRVESTITESNGSSSMASVCGGTLAMLDAGVPLAAPVAGVAMGLILEKQDSETGGDDREPRFLILTDILGSEDALGDMDFKVAGSADAITAFQMDIKVEGITLAVVEAALAAAGKARAHILGEMEKCAPPPRRALSPYAPRIELLTVPPDRLGTLIGPGGRTVRAVRDATGCTEVQVVDNEGGVVELTAPSDASLDAARAMIYAIVTDPEPGTPFPGSRVVSVQRFGLVVEFVPGKSGLAHASELPPGRGVDEYEVGDRIDVVVLEAGDGRYKLSARSASERADDADRDPPPPPGPPPPPPTPGRIYRGATVRGVAAFGVFVDLGGGASGLAHVSELTPPRPADAGDRFEKGDKVDVVVLAVGDGGKVSLSQRQVDAYAAESEGDGEGDAPGTPVAREVARPGVE